MANPQVYTWPVASATAVAALQDKAAAGNLLLSGTNNGLSVDLGRVNRVITLTSANNLSAVNVTITGTLNGVVVTETRVGPNANTVATTQVFSTVTSIAVDDAAAAISAGTGTSGYTDWFMFDRHASVANTAIQVDATATLSYSWQVTLDNVETTAAPLTFTPIVAMTTATTDQLAVYTSPFMYCRVAMISSDATGAFTCSILQQGLKS